MPPLLQAGAWRVRKRNLQTNEVACVTLPDAETFEQAKAAVQALAGVTEKMEDLSPEADTTTIAGSMAAWLEVQDVRERTRRGYKNEIGVLGRALGETTPVGDLKLETIERLFFKDWADLSGATKVSRVKLLRRWGEYLVDHEIQKDNPIARFRIPRAWKQEMKTGVRTKGTLTVEQARALLAACEGGHIVGMKTGAVQRERTSGVWLVVFLGLKLGLRIGNLLGLESHGTKEKEALRWGDFDLQAGTLRIPRERMKNNQELFVPVNTEAWRKLRELQVSLGRIPAPEEPVIPYMPDACKKYFWAACKAANLPEWVSFHTLRRTFASQLAPVAPFAALQVLMGHSGRTVTELYVDFPEKDLRAIVDRLPPLLKKPKQSLDSKKVAGTL